MPLDPKVIQEAITKSLSDVLANMVAEAEKKNGEKPPTEKKTEKAQAKPESESKTSEVDYDKLVGDVSAKVLAGIEKQFGKKEETSKKEERPDVKGFDVEAITKAVTTSVLTALGVEENADTEVVVKGKKRSSVTDSADDDGRFLKGKVDKEDEEDEEDSDEYFPRRKRNRTLEKTLSALTPEGKQEALNVYMRTLIQK